jgi:ribosomal protein S18 acetylase RimI-like enzyme
VDAWRHKTIGSSGERRGTLLAVMSSRRVDLVQIGPDDWREFRAVRLSALRDAPAAFGARHAEWADATEDRWRARLIDVPFTVVARSGTGPAGVVSGSESGKAVELISLWVEPAHRGTGVAGQLIDRVVGWAAASGRRTFLMVRDDNLGAIRAYIRAGFVDHGVPEDWPGDAAKERRMWHEPTRSTTTS